LVELLDVGAALLRTAYRRQTPSRLPDPDLLLGEEAPVHRHTLRSGEVRWY
jgi:hypothetical protein